MTGRITVASSDELEAGGILPVDVDGRELVVWRTASGRACVSDARCPHQWSHFASQGAVDGEELVCLSHQWRFDTDGAGCRESFSGAREPTGTLPMVTSEERDGVITIAATPT